MDSLFTNTLYPCSTKISAHFVFAKAFIALHLQ